MMHEQGSDLNTVYKYAVTRVHGTPQYSPSPRGNLTHEVINGNITLLNPRARIITSPARKVNYRFAAAEFIWYWTGNNSLEWIERYNKRLRDFSDDGATLNSAYGYRIFGPRGHAAGPMVMNQWARAVETLRRDPDSRQAILEIFSSFDLTRPTKDVPCTCTLQFFVRCGRLDMHAHMRSNDLIWGLPYDAFSFTMMQEAMALELGVELGSYYHTAGSMHIYQRHFEMAQEIKREPPYGSPPMPAISSLESLWRACMSEPYVATGQDIPQLLQVPRDTGEGWLVARLEEHWKERLHV